MAINATIIANTSALVSSQSVPPIVLKNNPSSVSQNYLSHLLDVVADHPVDGDTVIYNANTGKYDIAPPNFSSVTIDGGTF